MNFSRLRSLAYLSVCIVGAIIILFLFLRYLFVPLLPFLLAWGVALILRPPSEFLSKKLRLNRKVIAVALAILFVLIGIGLTLVLLAFGVRELWQFLSDFTSGNGLSDMLSKLTRPLGGISGNRFAVSEYVEDMIKNAVSAILSKLVDLLSAAVSAIPKILLFILATVVSSIYFSLDLERINKKVLSIMPKKAVVRLRRVKKRFLTVGIKYIKSYLSIMIITFSIMLVGFLILGVKKSVLIAVLVSLLDLLPIIGVGTILVPWSVYQLITGNLYVGVGLAILFLVHEITRQFVEPKILGKNLGIHPILSFLLIYVGYSVFGILGLVFLPVIGAFAVMVLNKNNSPEVL